MSTSRTQYTAWSIRRTEKVIACPEKVKSEDFEQAGATVIGVSRDPVKKLDRFKAKYDLKVVLASDEPEDVTEAWGVWVEKKLYGREYMGIERATFLIDGDGVVRRVWRKVSVKGHAAEVLTAAQSI